MKHAVAHGAVLGITFLVGLAALYESGSFTVTILAQFTACVVTTRLFDEYL